MGFVEHDDVVLGQQDASGREIEAVVVMVGDDDVSLHGFGPGLLGEAAIAGRALGGSGAFVGADTDGLPQFGRGSWVEFLAVTGVGVVGPRGERGQWLFGPRASQQVELFGAVGPGQLFVAL